METNLEALEKKVSQVMQQKMKSIDVGSRLRELRTERNLSMRALARECGLSTNALSMIERNLTSPSVSSLHKIANALGVPVTAFFRLEPPRQKVVYQKAKEHKRVPFLRGLWEGLGGEAFIGGMEPFMLMLEAGGGSGKHGMIHTGHEFVYCLEGEIEYEVEGERFLLEQGDSLLFAAQQQHRWRNPTKNISRAIIVISGFQQGEQPSEFHVLTNRETLD